eukprot:Rhum_TRINITY_DN12311_c1_g1::Rhum_TRINITY_DN12311_c1_g1_i1::g.50932::m.50932
MALTPFIGFASIGFTGRFSSSRTVSRLRRPPRSSAGINASNDGISLKARFRRSAAEFINHCSAASGMPHTSNSTRTKACASALRTVCSASPMRILPCSDRVMKLASIGFAARIIAEIQSLRLFCTSFPLAIATCFSEAYTPNTVSLLGWISMVWLDLVYCATSARSPVFLYFSLICFSLSPPPPAMHFTRNASPMPSSMPSTAGASLFSDRYTADCSVPGAASISAAKHFAMTADTSRRPDSADTSASASHRKKYGTSSPSLQVGSMGVSAAAFTIFECASAVGRSDSSTSATFKKAGSSSAGTSASRARNAARDASLSGARRRFAVSDADADADVSGCWAAAGSAGAGAGGHGTATVPSSRALTSMVGCDVSAEVFRAASASAFLFFAALPANMDMRSICFGAIVEDSNGGSNEVQIL